MDYDEQVPLRRSGLPVDSTRRRRFPAPRLSSLPLGGSLSVAKLPEASRPRTQGRRQARVVDPTVHIPFLFLRDRALVPRSRFRIPARARQAGAHLI